VTVMVMVMVYRCAQMALFSISVLQSLLRAAMCRRSPCPKHLP
jgi:hypothetical protein